MKYLILLSLLISCAHGPKKVEDEDNLVSVDTALMQAQASYLKGCVDALKALNVAQAFPGCRDKSVIHRKEIENFMQENP